MARAKSTTSPAASDNTDTPSPAASDNTDTPSPAASDNTDTGTGLVYPGIDQVRALPVGQLGAALAEARAFMAAVSEVINARAGETE